MPGEEKVWLSVFKRKLAAAAAAVTDNRKSKSDSGTTIWRNGNAHELEELSNVKLQTKQPLIVAVAGSQHHQMNDNDDDNGSISARTNLRTHLPATTTSAILADEVL